MKKSKSNQIVANQIDDSDRTENVAALFDERGTSLSSNKP